MPPTVGYPGQPVRTSGLYRVVHYKHRESDTEISFVTGEIFPHCGPCDNLVDYILIRECVGPMQMPGLTPTELSGE